MAGWGGLEPQERAVVQRRPQSDRRRLCLRLQKAFLHHGSNIVNHHVLQDDLLWFVISQQPGDNAAFRVKTMRGAFDSVVLGDLCCRMTTGVKHEQLLYISIYFDFGSRIWTCCTNNSVCFDFSPRESKDD